MWVRPTQAPDDDVQVFYLGNRASVSHVGAVLGERYELLKVLGLGGTAAVYRALDKRTKATVAVKVLHAGAHETIGAFFQQEGRLTARIASPHLVRAHDFGEDEGRLFIVFDLVPGEALSSMFYGRVMPWRELGLVVLHVLDALAALHRLGIVHRDVKPDNVYVGRKLGDELHATLLDLGFALVPPERRLTNAPVPSRTVFGTEGFIAPELLAGCPPEPRSDLYSVGALMYTMLTAQPVPDISACPEEMVIPSPRAFLPTIPQAVDDVVMRALSDVEARFQNAAEMAAAIRAAMSTAEANATASDVARMTAAELPAANAPAAAVSTASASTAPAGLMVGSASRSSAELAAASVSTGEAGSAAGLPAASVSTGDTGRLIAPTAGPSAASPASPQNHAARRRSRTRLAAAYLTAGLVGAGSMYVATVAAPPGDPQGDVPATACAAEAATETTVPRVVVAVLLAYRSLAFVVAEAYGYADKHWAESPYRTTSLRKAEETLGLEPVPDELPAPVHYGPRKLVMRAAEGPEWPKMVGLGYLPKSRLVDAAGRTLGEPFRCTPEEAALPDHLLCQRGTTTLVPKLAEMGTVAFQGLHRHARAVLGGHPADLRALPRAELLRVVKEELVPKLAGKVRGDMHHPEFFPHCSMVLLRMVELAVELGEDTRKFRAEEPEPFLHEEAAAIRRISAG